MVELLTKWRRATAELQDESGRAPTEEEIATSLNLSKKKLAIIKKAIRIHNASPQGEDDCTLDESFGDERAATPDLAMGQADDLRQVLALLERMDGRGKRRPQPLPRVRQSNPKQNRHTQSPPSSW